jgi:hypothetical protein
MSDSSRLLLKVHFFLLIPRKDEFNFLHIRSLFYRLCMSYVVNLDGMN